MVNNGGPQLLAPCREHRAQQEQGAVAIGPVLVGESGRATAIIPGCPVLIKSATSCFVTLVLGRPVLGRLVLVIALNHQCFTNCPNSKYQV